MVRDDSNAGSKGCWRNFLGGPVYEVNAVPWLDDPAYAMILEQPGLRDQIGGNVAAALNQAIGLVGVVSGVDVGAVIEAERARKARTRAAGSSAVRLQGRDGWNAQGLCLGFGNNFKEVYDVLKVFGLDGVHAYEWVGEHVLAAARGFAREDNATELSRRILLHHGTISALGAISGASVLVVYTGNVFHPEIPMVPETFDGATSEILRVLAPQGFVISRGSAGQLELALSQKLKLLLDNPLVSVLQNPAANQS